MKKLTAIALTGIGVLLAGTRSYQRGLSGNLALPIYSKNLSFELKTGLEEKIIGYSSVERDLALKDYTSYKLRLDESVFLNRAKVVDLLWGKKYRENIDSSLWETRTDGIFDANLAYALGMKESFANPKDEQKETGARGFWQIMPGTWADLTKLHFDDAFDFKKNEELAVKNLERSINYLEKNLDFWDYLSREDKQKLAVASHNWGQGRVVRAKGDLYKSAKETRDLIQKVFTYYEYLNSIENENLVGSQNFATPD